MTIARYYARGAVKRELRSRGIKLVHVEAGEITRAANQYIEDHPQIITFASEQYRSLVVGDCDRRSEGNLCSTSNSCTKTKALTYKGFRCANVMFEMERQS